MTTSKEYLSLLLFHDKFGMPTVSYPQLLDEDLMDFRVRFMAEEFQEIKDAYEEGDLAKVADGLVDLVYVAMGTAELMGLPWDELWAEVQRANMSKRRVKRPDEGPRGSIYDVVKPDDWCPPDIEGVLKDHEEGSGREYNRHATILRSGHRVSE